MDTTFTKVAVVGTGMVGMSYAYVLTIKGLAHRLGLTNRTRERAEGEAMDLNHGLAFAAPVDISAGGYEVCKGADLVAFCAGANQEPGQSRLDLVKKNTAIVRDAVPRILDAEPETVILVVSNPVDVLTYVALKESGLPRGRVMGAGTALDTARFRYMLSVQCGVDVRNVHGYVAGEHGDSEVPLWSRVNIAGAPLDEYCRSCTRHCPDDMRSSISERVRNSAYEIIERKGATYYAIGLAMARVTEAVLKDQHSVLTVSSLVEDYYGINDVCLSLPCVVGRAGVERVLHTPISDDEVEALRRSAHTLRRSLESVGL